MKTTTTNCELNGYVIGKTIGKGTFGKVKRAIHKVTSQPVAIKILQKDKIKDISDVQRVSRELHILKIVRHSSISQLYQIIQTPSLIYIVMEYAENGQFFDFVMDFKIQTQQEAHHYFMQILSGLIYLHKIGIAHRDVKPQNILLDTHKRLKIVDFGLSNMYKKEQLLSTACGSPCYASPQMIKGQKYNPQLADVWSLGIVLYSMIFAKLPFQDDNTSILYSKIKSGMYMIDRKISPQLKDLISRMINVKPQNRLNLQQIAEHKWCRMFQKKKRYGISIGYQKIPIDNQIVQQMSCLGYNQKTTIKYLQNNIKNECTATYYLYLKRNFKMGKSSAMDICSQNFQKRMLSPVFSKHRHKSFDFSSIIQKEDKQERMLRRKNCISQLKYRYQSNYKKDEQRQSVQKKSKEGSTKSKSKKKINIFNNPMIVKKKSPYLNKSTSVSRYQSHTSNVRNSNQLQERLKNSTDSKKYKQIQNFKQMNIQRKPRLKTDFVRDIYLPRKSNQKKNININININNINNMRNDSRQKLINKNNNNNNQKRSKLIQEQQTKLKQIDITGVFWKKKSITKAKTQGRYNTDADSYYVRNI